MEQNLENYDFGLKDANEKILKKNTDNVDKSHMGHFPQDGENEQNLSDFFF